MSEPIAAVATVIACSLTIELALALAMKDARVYELLAGRGNGALGRSGTH